jgi:type I restriction enzyme M protein
MAIKKSELYASLWKSCDELRGGMDASQYKDYVLALLFVKYISDKAASQRDYLLRVPAGASFDDMVALKGDKDIGDKMNKILSRLGEANDLKGVIDAADFNDDGKLGKGQEMVDRLSSLVAIFENSALDFSSNRAEGDDILGDAYEYLMRHFATESGKSKGQFYTPAEVSRIMAKVIRLGEAQSPMQSIYDPTCGSGSLLLRAHDEAKGSTGLDLATYGQERDNATSALATMNMILHGCTTAEITNDNTLSAPQFKDSKTGGLKAFDFAVANPPFSTKAWSHGFNPADDAFKRFAYGVPPARNGDYAFLLHLLASLKSTGKGAIILPHGVLFRANAESDIRREVVRRGFIKGIVGLPANLFYGTGIPACIVVLDKENAAGRKGIFMIDASKGFLKDGPKNRLRERDIHQIVDVFNSQRLVPKYSRMVSIEEIEKNEFNLNLSRYVDSQEPQDLQDIEGHLRGGIPSADVEALSPYWSVCPSLRQALFADLRPGYVRLVVDRSSIRTTIYEHPEFVRFTNGMEAHFAAWRSRTAAALEALQADCRPKAIVAELGESILAHYANKPLVGPYDVYQQLMDYWSATMQDDCYLIAGDGWRALPYRVTEVRKGKEGKPGKKVDKGWACDLVPKSLIVARYFTDERAAVAALEAELERISAKMTELEEARSGDDWLFLELDRIDRANVTARLKEIARNGGSEDEAAALNAWLTLASQEAVHRKALREAEADLDAKALAKYPTLAEAEIRSLVIKDKWLTAMAAAVNEEMVRVSENLAERVMELAERYATPLPLALSKVAALDQAVVGHLERMGFSWN